MWNSSDKCCAQAKRYVIKTQCNVGNVFRYRFIKIPVKNHELWRRLAGCEYKYVHLVKNEISKNFKKGEAHHNTDWTGRVRSIWSDVQYKVNIGKLIGTQTIKGNQLISFHKNCMDITKICDQSTRIDITDRSSCSVSDPRGDLGPEVGPRPRWREQPRCIRERATVLHTGDRNAAGRADALYSKRGQKNSASPTGNLTREYILECFSWLLALEHLEAVLHPNVILEENAYLSVWVRREDWYQLYDRRYNAGAGS